MKDFLPKLLIGFSLLALGFGYGFASSHFRIFPYKDVRNAYVAFQALRDLRKENPRMKNVESWEETDLRKPLYRKVRPDAGSEPILILGNERTYADDKGQSYGAWIADRDGTILHAWKYPGEIWKLGDRKAVGDFWRSYPVGAHVFPNGDLLVSYQGVGMFPPAMGLAKFDKDSNILWKNPGLLHHWFSVGPDGKIYIPGRKTGASPMALPDREKEIVCEQIDFGYDSIDVFDANGRKLREIDTLQALADSDLTGLFNSNQEQPDAVETCDPTHLNDVQILTQDMAAQYPRFKAGDLLVSFRTLNTIGVLDPETELFKWHFQGPSHHQHSPRFLGNDVIVFLDNLGGQVSRGTSRILAVNVDSSAFESVFPRAGVELPEMEFRTKNAGSIDTSAGGDRILVSWTRQGLVWEIDVSSGELLWEFVNTHTVDGRPARISTYTAKYVPRPAFEMNGGRLD